jgi:hypothetical protein
MMDELRLHVMSTSKDEVHPKKTMQLRFYKRIMTILWIVDRFGLLLTLLTN